MSQLSKHPSNRLCYLAILVSAWLAPPPAFGHDFFLIATPPRLVSPGSTTVAMHVTDTFPGESIGWRADKVMSMAAFGPGGNMAADCIWPKQGEKGVTAPLAKEGSYVVAVTVSPSSIKLDGADFNEYISHEGHDALLQARKDSGSLQEPVRERYSRFVKTIVGVGSKTQASTAHISKPTGQRIEIVPLSNPADLQPGQKLEFRVRYNGRPLAGALVSATNEHYLPSARAGSEHAGDDHEHGNEHYASAVRTDQNGQSSIPITKPGHQLIRTTYMIELKEDKDFDYESFWASLTFDVKELGDRQTTPSSP